MIQLKTKPDIELHIHRTAEQVLKYLKDHPQLMIVHRPETGWVYVENPEYSGERRYLPYGMLFYFPTTIVVKLLTKLGKLIIPRPDMCRKEFEIQLALGTAKEKDWMKIRWPIPKKK